MGDDPLVRRIESSLRGSGGLRIQRRAWLPRDPSRALVLVHGYAEHSGRYEHVGRWFAGRGVAVHAYDHRGHGRSEGTRAHVARFDDFLDDLEAVLAHVRAAQPGLPVAILGHSMGGLVTAALLAERQPQVACAILSGPLLAMGEGVSRLRITAARLLRRVVPELALGSGLDPDGLSRDPDVVRAYVEDPLVFRTMTASLGAEILDAVPRTAAAAGRVQAPLLVLHGADDPMCPPDGSRTFAARVPGSALRIYPGLRHEILNEPEREQVLDDAWRWLEEHAG